MFKGLKSKANKVFHRKDKDKDKEKEKDHREKIWSLDSDSISLEVPHHVTNASPSSSPQSHSSHKHSLKVGCFKLERSHSTKSCSRKKHNNEAGALATLAKTSCGIMTVSADMVHPGSISPNINAQVSDDKEIFQLVQHHHHRHYHYIPISMREDRVQSAPISLAATPATPRDDFIDIIHKEKHFFTKKTRNIHKNSECSDNEFCDKFIPLGEHHLRISVNDSSEVFSDNQGHSMEEKFIRCLELSPQSTTSPQILVSYNAMDQESGIFHDLIREERKILFLCNENYLEIFPESLDKEDFTNSTEIVTIKPLDYNPCPWMGPAAEGATNQVHECTLIATKEAPLVKSENSSHSYANPISNYFLDMNNANVVGAKSCSQEISRESSLLTGSADSNIMDLCDPVGVGNLPYEYFQLNQNDDTNSEIESEVTSVNCVEICSPQFIDLKGFCSPENQTSFDNIEDTSDEFDDPPVIQQVVSSVQAQKAFLVSSSSTDNLTQATLEEPNVTGTEDHTFIKTNVVDFVKVEDDNQTSSGNIGDISDEFDNPPVTQQVVSSVPAQNTFLISSSLTGNLIEAALEDQSTTEMKSNTFTETNNDNQTSSGNISDTSDESEDPMVTQNEFLLSSSPTNNLIHAALKEQKLIETEENSFTETNNVDFIKLENDNQTSLGKIGGISDEFDDPLDTQQDVPSVQAQNTFPMLSRPTALEEQNVTQTEENSFTDTNVVDFFNVEDVVFDLQYSIHQNDNLFLSYSCKAPPECFKNTNSISKDPSESLISYDIKTHHDHPSSSICSNSSLNDFIPVSSDNLLESLPSYLVEPVGSTSSPSQIIIVNADADHIKQTDFTSKVVQRSQTHQVDSTRNISEIIKTVNVDSDVEVNGSSEGGGMDSHESDVKVSQRILVDASCNTCEPCFPTRVDASCNTEDLQVQGKILDSTCNTSEPWHSTDSKEHITTLKQFSSTAIQCNDSGSSNMESFNFLYSPTIDTNHLESGRDLLESSVPQNKSDSHEIIVDLPQIAESNLSYVSTSNEPVILTSSETKSHYSSDPRSNSDPSTSSGHAFTCGEDQEYFTKLPKYECTSNYSTLEESSSRCSHSGISEEGESVSGNFPSEDTVIVRNEEELEGSMTSGKGSSNYSSLSSTSLFSSVYNLFKKNKVSQSPILCQMPRKKMYSMSDTVSEAEVNRLMGHDLDDTMSDSIVVVARRANQKVESMATSDVNYPLWRVLTDMFLMRDPNSSSPSPPSSESEKRFPPSCSEEANPAENIHNPTTAGSSAFQKDEKSKRKQFERDSQSLLRMTTKVLSLPQDLAFWLQRRMIFILSRSSSVLWHEFRDTGEDNESRKDSHQNSTAGNFSNGDVTASSIQSTSFHQPLLRRRVVVTGLFLMATAIAPYYERLCHSAYSNLLEFLRGQVDFSLPIDQPHLLIGPPAYAPRIPLAGFSYSQSAPQSPISTPPMNRRYAFLNPLLLPKSLNPSSKTSQS